MAHDRRQILMLAAAGAVLVAVTAVTEGVLRGADPDQFAIAALSGPLFFGLLSAQVLKPRSLTRAWALAAAAVTAVICAPVLGALGQSTETYPAITILSGAVLLAFTNSVIGWIAALAAVGFVAELMRRHLVDRPVREATEDERAEDAAVDAAAHRAPPPADLPR